MSRSPTRLDDFYNHIQPIQPDARPTDQFVSPNARQGGGGSLLAFAHSLKSIEPVWQQIVDRQSAGEKEASSKAAEMDYANRRADNAAGFKSAVDAGQISQASSPWYNIRTQQLMAQDKMAGALSQATKDWQTTPDVRDSDDPQKVQAFFAQRIQGVMGGMNAWEAEVAVPFSQQAMQHLMAQHWAHRDTARVQEAEMAYKQQIFNLLSTHGIDEQTEKDMKSSDPTVANAANARYQQAQAAIQQTMSNQLQVSNKVQVNQWTHDALSQAALSRESGSVFGLYMGLKKEDGSPLDLSASDHQRDLDRIISDRKLQSRREEAEGLKLDDDRYMREGNKAWADYQTQLIDKDPHWSLLNLNPQTMQDFTQKLRPEIRQRFYNELAQIYYSTNNVTDMYRSEQGKKLIMDQAADISTGNLTGLNRQQLFLGLAKLGQPTLIHQVAVDNQFASKQWAPQTSPAALEAYYNLRAAGEKVDVDKVSELTRTFGEDQISEQDFARWNEHALSQRSENYTRSEPIFQRAMLQLDRQIDTKYVDDTLAKPSESVAEMLRNAKGEDPRTTVENHVHSSTAFRNDVMDGKNELGRTWERMTRDPEMKELLSKDPEKFESELMKRVDDISTKFGGYNNEQFKSSQTKLSQPQKPQATPVELPRVQYKVGTPEAFITQGTVEKLLPATALLPMASQEKVNSLLSTPPPGISEGIKQNLRPPVDPSARWNFMSDPKPHDWAGQLSYLRELLNHSSSYSSHVSGEAGYANVSYDPGFAARTQAKFNDAVLNARSQARRIEATLPPNVTEAYQHYLDSSATTGQLSPSQWTDMRKTENHRIEAVLLRKSAGYYPAEVKAAMATDANAWQTHPMFTNLEDFNPSNVQKLLDVMKEIGLDPKDKYTRQLFFDRQQQLTSDMLLQK